MARRDWPLLQHPDIEKPIRCAPDAAAYYLGRGWSLAPEPEPPTVTPPDDPAPTRARRKPAAQSSSEED